MGKVTPEAYHQLAQKRGFEWVGPEVTTVMHGTGWKCSMGHYWVANYNHIKTGTGCPTCANNKRRTPDDYHSLAERRGFQWLGPEPKNNRTKTAWRCPEGHIWETTYTLISQGHGCSVCAGRIPKTEEDYHSIANKSGIFWIGPELPRTISIRTSWMCPKGHQWKTNYLHIQQGTRCGACATEAWVAPQRLKSEDYHKLASEKGFKWLGPEVSNALTSTTWKCSQGHIWEARYGNIYSGRGCPTCVDMVNGALVSKPQRELCSMVNGELNRPFGPYTIDVALRIQGVNIAIEYDCYYWHSKRLDRDRLKNKKLIKAGWRVLRIKTEDSMPTLDQIKKGINRLLSGEALVEIVLDDWLHREQSARYAARYLQAGG